jgi:hypothetical protein
LHADDQSEDDGTQLIQHPDPRYEMSNDRRADSDGQTDHCADLTDFITSPKAAVSG